MVVAESKVTYRMKFSLEKKNNFMLNVSPIHELLIHFFFIFGSKEP